MSTSASATAPIDRRRGRRRGPNSSKLQRRGADELSENEEDYDFNVEEEEEEGDWHASESSGDDDEEEFNTSTRALCIYCNQAEDNDPSTEFEIPLECMVCGCLSHRQCARSTTDALNSTNAGQSAFDEETGEWRCPTCPEYVRSPSASSTKRAALRHQRSSQPTNDDCTDLFHPDSNTMQGDVSSERESVEQYRSGRKRKAMVFDESDASPMSQPVKRRYNRRKKELSSDSEDAGVEGGLSDGGRAADQARGEQEDDEHQEAEEALDAAIKKMPRVSLKAPKVSKPRGRPRIKKSNVNILVKKTSRRCMLHVTGLNPKKLAAALRDASRSTRRRALSTNNLHTPQSSTHQQTPFYVPQTPFISFYPNQPKIDEEPYGGILSEVDGDTSRTLPTQNDRLRFDKAKQEVDEERATRLRLSALSSIAINNINSSSTFGTGSAESSDDNASKSHLPEAAQGSASRIKCIHFGNFEIDTWYTAPYPEEFHKNKVLYICEFCLKYMNSEYVSWRHKLKCPAKHPPGDEIYRDGSISVFEVDGRKNPTYCQNLCLLAKLFLGSKTLYYDVDPFLFYVMTEYDETGCHFVGYFSKEKRSTSPYNVSCILTLPIHQRKGYGNLLIDFSYLLTRVEGRIGSPEKPLSDLGLVSYRNYWRLVLCCTLRSQKGDVSIEYISKKTGMTPDDIICALEGLHALVRDPITGKYALRFDYRAFEMHIARWEAKNYVKLNPNALIWSPFVMGRVDSLGPPVSTVAPRERAEDNLIEQEQEQEQEEEQDMMDLDKPEEADGELAEQNVRAKSTYDGPKGSRKIIDQQSICYIDATSAGSRDPEIPAGLKKDQNTEMSDSVATPGVSSSSTVDKGKRRAFQGLPPPPGKPQHVIKLGHELLSSNEPSIPTPFTTHGATKKNVLLSNPKNTFHDPDIYSIPPTRFQIYPPLPGSTPFRRGGRSGGPGRGTRKAINLSPSTPRNRLIGSPRNNDGVATAPPRLASGRGGLRSRRKLPTASETLTRSAKKLRERELKYKGAVQGKGDQTEMEGDEDEDEEVQEDEDEEDQEGEDEGVCDERDGDIVEAEDEEIEMELMEEDVEEEEEGVEADTVKVNGMFRRVHGPSGLRSTVALRSDPGTPESPSPIEYRGEIMIVHDKDDSPKKDRQSKQLNHNISLYSQSPPTPSLSNYQSVSSSLTSTTLQPKFDFHSHSRQQLLKRNSNSPPKAGGIPSQNEGSAVGAKTAAAKAQRISITAVSVGSKML